MPKTLRKTCSSRRTEAIYFNAKIKSNSVIGQFIKTKRGSIEEFATIIRERICKDSSNKHEYYVHFHSTDTKFDRWIKREEIISFEKDHVPKRLDFTSENALDKELLDNKYLTEPLLPLDNYPVKNLEKIFIDEFWVPAWYSSPYPEGYSSVSELFICAYCFQYFANQKMLKKHQTKCFSVDIYKPDSLIYTYDNLSVYRFNGIENKLFCQNLCLYSKIFIGHKELCFNVSCFDFFVLVRNDPLTKKQTPVGYYSKEIKSTLHNLSCLLVFPLHHGQCFGRFLIEFSYKMSELDNLIGSPERPLSEQGCHSYYRFWSSTIADLLISLRGEISFSKISSILHISIVDIKSTFSYLGLNNIINSESTSTDLALEPHIIIKALKAKKIRIESRVNPKGFIKYLV